MPQHELVGLDNLEYSYHDGNICDLKMSPEEAELVVPRCWLNCGGGGAQHFLPPHQLHGSTIGSFLSRFILSDRQADIDYWDGQMKEARSKMDQEDVGVGARAEPPQDFDTPTNIGVTM